MFDVNQELIAKAREILNQRENIYWIIGGACSGKSTVSRVLSETKGIAGYDMDEHIFGGYMGLYSEERHPASTAWFGAPNPFVWAFSLPWEEFNALNRAANAEYLDLLAGELEQQDQDQSLLIEGGITHPAILAQVIPPDQILCLEISEENRLSTWKNSTERAEMKSWVYALPDPERQWQIFLDLDKAMSQIIVNESRDEAIKIVFREEYAPVNELANEIATHFGI
jgi:hypothetical protein